MRRPDPPGVKAREVSGIDILQMRKLWQGVKVTTLNQDLTGRWNCKKRNGRCGKKWGGLWLGLAPS